MTTSTESRFSGPYSKALQELSELITWLWTEHDKSFVKAGDDKVYAFGGGGYVVVFDEARLDGVVEVIAPSGTITVKSAEGTTQVTGPTEDQSATNKVLSEAIAGIRKYYEHRYWTTPKAS